MRRKQRHITALLIGLAFLSACDNTTREARRMVKRAEQLADTLPDSTVRLIDSVLRMPASFSERERMDMALLQAEALFGDHGQEIPPLMDDEFFDDNPFLTTSPELERAADYYARKKQYDKSAHAALYSGFIQQRHGEKFAAMRSFKDAEQYGGMAKDSLSMAVSGYWMGKLLYYEGREKDALSSLMASLILTSNHYAVKSLIENSRAAVYLLLNQNDSVVTCLQRSFYYANNSHSNKAKYNVLNNYAVFYRVQGKFDQAIKCLKQIEDGHVLDEKEMLLLNLNLGNVYFDKGKMDSANYYYKRVEGFIPTTEAKPETQLAAYDALYKFSTSRNDDSLALLYREKHEDILYDIMQHRQEQNTYRIQQHYDYESLQNKMIQERSRMQRFVAIGIVLLLCIVALFFYQSSQRNKKETETNANLFHFMQQNKALVESNMAHEKKAIDTMQQLSDVLFARLKAMQKLDYSLKNPKDKIAIKDLEKEVFGDGEHWKAVKEVLDALYPGLWESLKLKYPEMDEMERRVFMMSRLKLSRLGEATLLGISTSVLDKLRTKVHRIVEEEKI